MSAFGVTIAQWFDYETLKMLHLFGIIVFVGNIIVTGWWKTLADRTGDPGIVAFAQRQVTLTDWIFTFGGVLITLVAGFGMVYHINPDIMAEIHAQRWLWWGYVLFVISGVIWAAVLVPLQILQARMAREFAVSRVIPPRYWVYGRLWLWFGILATIIPLANLYWMVSKAA